MIDRWLPNNIKIASISEEKGRGRLGFRVQPVTCTAAAAEFDDEQHIQPLERGCLHREEVDGDLASCLCSRDRLRRDR